MVWWEDIKQTGERETKRRVFFFIDRSICFDYDSKLGLDKKKKKIEVVKGNKVKC